MTQFNFQPYDSARVLNEIKVSQWGILLGRPVFEALGRPLYLEVLADPANRAIMLRPTAESSGRTVAPTPTKKEQAPASYRITHKQLSKVMAVGRYYPLDTDPTIFVQE